MLKSVETRLIASLLILTALSPCHLVTTIADPQPSPPELFLSRHLVTIRGAPQPSPIRAIHDSGHVV